MEDIKLAYQVNPKRPIRELPEFGLIRTNRTMYLTKEQVLKILPRATVYRRFSHDKIEKVSIYNLDELHVESLEAPLKFDENTIIAREEKEEITVEPSNVVEDEIPSNTTEIIENVVIDETPVQEDTISGAITDDNTVIAKDEAETEVEIAVEEPTVATEEAPVDVESEVISDEVAVESEDETVEDNSEEIVNASRTSVNYNGKKKHHH